MKFHWWTYWVAIHECEERRAQAWHDFTIGKRTIDPFIAESKLRVCLKKRVKREHRYWKWLGKFEIPAHF